MLSPIDRRRMVDLLKPADDTPVTGFGENYEPIVKSGLVKVSEKGIRPKEEFQLFLSLIREFKGFHQNASQNRMVDYLIRYFSSYQIQYMGGYRYGSGGTDLAYMRLTSDEWVTDFLKRKDGKQWEASVRTYDDPVFMSEPGTFPVLQKILFLLLDQKQPIPIRDLPQWVKKTPEEMGHALNAGLRYVLFYLSADSETLEPVLFVWPDILRRLNRSSLKPPAPVAPEGEETSVPFLALDMAVILSECIQEPFRIRVGDYVVYEKVLKHLNGQIAPLDDWVFHYHSERNENRVDHTVWLARSHGFIEAKQAKDSPPKYEVTPKGHNWLALPQKERLKGLAEITKPSRGANNITGSLPYYNYYRARSKEQDFKILEQGLVQSMKELERDTFYPLEDFLDYQACERNPLLRKDKESKQWVNRVLSYEYQGNQSVKEFVWKMTVEGYLFRVLQPLGGLRLCRRPDGTLLFALSGIGRYILQFEPDFDMEEAPLDLVVQPNFEVVFLAPSVQAEAVFSRFAERLSRGVGTLFRITKKSIQRAASSGLTLESILQDLSRMSRTEISQNVWHEVEEWYGSIKHVSLQPVFLVRCPDETTAALVCAKAGKSAETVSNTLVALPKDFDKARLFAKLREVGVFLEKKDVE